jgi:hypothetical protein
MEGDGPAGVLDKRFEISEIRDDGGTTYPDTRQLFLKRPNFDANLL